MNAFRHGLIGQIVILTSDDQQAFQKHCDAIVQALAPVGPRELDLAQSIAEDKWHLHRARALENSVFALGHREHSRPDAALPEVDAALAQGQTWIAQAKNLQLLSLYEQRSRRGLEKNTDELRALQTERKIAVAKAQEEARLLVKLASPKAITTILP